MRLAAPKPVKKALPWLERFEPSIKKRPFDLKPQRSSSRATRAASSPSVIGVNLLKSGMMSAG